MALVWSRSTAAGQRRPHNWHMPSAKTPTGETSSCAIAPQLRREMAICQFEHGLRTLPAKSCEQLLLSLARLFGVAFVSCFQLWRILGMKNKNIWRRGTSHPGCARHSPTSGSYARFVRCLRVRQQLCVCRRDLLVQDSRERLRRSTWPFSFTGATVEWSALRTCDWPNAIIQKCCTPNFLSQAMCVVARLHAKAQSMYGRRAFECVERAIGRGTGLN